ncbi:MAG: DUF3352 domain-containing protein [Terrimicrobiaceae bacterium]
MAEIYAGRGGFQGALLAAREDLPLAGTRMKKVAIGLVVVGVLVLAGVMVFKRSSGPSQAASLAPAESVFFANVPNIPLTGFRWTRTALARIAAEPEMRAFLNKPLTDFKEAPANKEAMEILTKLKPGNVYFAATNESEEDFQGILGVQFWGKREDFDNAASKVRSFLSESSGDPASEEYRGLQILSTRHGDLTLYSAAAGRWGFFSNDAALIKEAIDRATGNAPSPALAANPKFLKVVTELLAEPDLLVFIQPEKAVDVLLAAGRAAGAMEIPEQVDQLKSTEAAGGSWKIDGEMFRDAFFLLRPGTGDPAEPMSHQSIALTTPETTLFFNFVLNFSSLPDWLERVTEFYPDAAQMIGPMAKSVAEGYGPECALIGSLESPEAPASLLLAIQVRNPGQGIPGVTQAGGSPTQVHQIPHPLMPVSAVQNEKFLILGTDPKSVTIALEEHSKTLQDAPLFRDARQSFRNSNEAFCFLDTRVVFERAYGALLPIVKMSAAIMPDITNRIDISKLPHPETIGQHLPPIVFSQKRTADGTRLESSGPVNMSQFLILAGTLSAGMQGSLLSL